MGLDQLLQSSVALVRPFSLGVEAGSADDAPAVQDHSAERLLGLGPERDGIAPTALRGGVVVERDDQCGSTRTTRNTRLPQKVHGAGRGIGVVLMVVAPQSQQRHPRRVIGARVTSVGGPRRSTTSSSSMPQDVVGTRECCHTPRLRAKVQSSLRFTARSSSMHSRQWRWVNGNKRRLPSRERDPCPPFRLRLRSSHASGNAL